MATISFKDTDGDHIVFSLDGCNIHYYVNGKLKVSNLTALRVDHLTLHLNGTSAGSWDSRRMTMVPTGHEAILKRVVALYQAAQAGTMVGFPDKDGDMIVFKLLGGILDYYVNGQAKVCRLTDLRAEGRTLYLDGTSAGPWDSCRMTEAPARLPEEAFNHIFELFKRSQRAARRRAPDGLHICAQCGPATALVPETCCVIDYAKHKETPQVLAMAMLNAGRAILEAAQSGAESANLSRCQQMVEKFFAAATEDNMDLLRRNWLLLTQQLQRNLGADAGIEVAPDGEFEPTWIAYTYPNVAPGKRKFYACPLFFAGTEIDNASTYLHEATHFCISTDDEGGYGFDECVALSKDMAVKNAQNYMLFCLWSFYSFCQGQLSEIYPARTSSKGLRFDAPQMQHVKGALSVKTDWSYCIYGDKCGQKSSGGAKHFYHSLAEKWHVKAVKGSTMELKNDKGQLLSAVDSAAGLTVSDTVNTFHVIMVNRDIGFGAVHCGGQGGRSFIFLRRGAAGEENLHMEGWTKKWAHDARRAA